jgi:hypothetical protein
MILTAGHRSWTVQASFKPSTFPRRSISVKIAAIEASAARISRASSALAASKVWKPASRKSSATAMRINGSSSMTRMLVCGMNCTDLVCSDEKLVGSPTCSYRRGAGISFNTYDPISRQKGTISRYRLNFRDTLVPERSAFPVQKRGRRNGLPVIASYIC